MIPGGAVSHAVPAPKYSCAADFSPQGQGRGSARAGL